MIEYTVVTLIVRLLITGPLAVFGFTFFKGDSYNRNQSHLAGALCYTSFYSLFVALLWGNQEYGTHIAFLIVLFYLTPLKTYVVTYISVCYCALFFAIVLFNSTIRAEYLNNCINDGLQFRCGSENEQNILADDVNNTKTTECALADQVSVNGIGGVQSIGDSFPSICAVLSFSIVVGVTISYRHEKVARRNFKTVKSSRLQVSIRTVGTHTHRWPRT